MKEITALIIAASLAVYGRASGVLDDILPGTRVEFSVRKRKSWKGGNYIQISEI
jgi:hypothetical protein